MWADEDPDAAMEAAMTVTDKQPGDWMRREVVDTALGNDLAKGLELAAKAGDFNRFSRGARAWITAAPEAAARGVVALPAISKYRDFLQYAHQAWATQDPRAALDWLTLENPLLNEPPRLNEVSTIEGSKAAAKVDLPLALASIENLKNQGLAMGGVPAGFRDAAASDDRLSNKRRG
jgi:hypothetical protein